MHLPWVDLNYTHCYVSIWKFQYITKFILENNIYIAQVKIKSGHSNKYNHCECHNDKSVSKFTHSIVWLKVQGWKGISIIGFFSSNEAENVKHFSQVTGTCGQ